MIAHATALIRAIREALTTGALRARIDALTADRDSLARECSQLVATAAGERIAAAEELRACDAARAGAIARAMDLDVRLGDVTRLHSNALRELDRARCEVAQLGARAAGAEERVMRLARDCSEAARGRGAT